MSKSLKSHTRTTLKLQSHCPDLAAEVKNAWLSYSIKSHFIKPNLLSENNSCISKTNCSSHPDDLNAFNRRESVIVA